MNLPPETPLVIAFVSLLVSSLAWLNAKRAREESERDRLFQLRYRAVELAKEIETARKQALMELSRRKLQFPAQAADAAKRKLIREAFASYEGAFTLMYENGRKMFEVVNAAALDAERAALEKSILQLVAIEREMTAEITEMRARLDQFELDARPSP